MPTINPRYLTEESDRRAIVGGLKFVRRMFHAPALQPYVGEEKLPGKQVQTDEELLDYAKRNGNTVYHASCTCMMGQHANVRWSTTSCACTASRVCGSSTPR